MARHSGVSQDAPPPLPLPRRTLHAPAGTRQPTRPTRQPPSLTLFVILMMVVIAIQGTYLGYVVGMLTTLERRFGISSEPSGSLLSIYDIGHTVAILLVGYLGEKSHHPRITGIGVILSAIAMFVLALPVALFGTLSQDELYLQKNREMYYYAARCDEDRSPMSEKDDCAREKNEHYAALLLLSFGQLLAGVFSAPFNTLAYVYIDNNVDDRRRSPFLLGLLTSMYAFGPAFGFLLSSALTRVYTTLGDPPPHLTPHDEEWVGAWWLGFCVCGVLYLLTAPAFFFFPQTYRPEADGVELQALHGTSKPQLPPAQFEEDKVADGCVPRLQRSFREFPLVVIDLLRNPVFVSMVLGWMFGSYLIAGYGTYLPKYIEMQFGQTASEADFYAGMISIGAIASSTALGGWLLSRTSVSPRPAILLLFGSWLIVFLAYIIGMLFGCEQPPVEGLHLNDITQRWSLHRDHFSSCHAGCRCSGVLHFDPVNYDGLNYFSPCHAGCTAYEPFVDQWSNCGCAGGNVVSKGLLHPHCTVSFIAYLAVMFIGLFLGNLFFMVTMMIVLRSVYDDEKVIALSFASCVTNLIGFIPAPLIFGYIIDSACTLWRSQCPDTPGNCVVYDNSSFRLGFHLTSAGLQLAAVICVGICWLVARRRRFPEEEDDEAEFQGR